MERTYETILIVNHNLADEERENVFQKIAKKIESFEGKVTNSKLWAKEKNFTYPLRSRDSEKKRLFKGTYWLINFNLDTSKLSELKAAIKLEERIIRNIIIKIEK